MKKEEIKEKAVEVAKMYSASEDDKMVELLSAIDEKILMNSKINDNLPYQSLMVA